MKRNYFSYVVYGIIALAIFGFIYTIINKPTQIVSTAFTIGITVLILYILIRLFTNMGGNGARNSNYNKAAKQSKKKYTQKNAYSSSSTKKFNKAKLEPIRKKAKAKSTANLTVIEGEKGKKKNRMTL